MARTPKLSMSVLRTFAHLEHERFRVAQSEDPKTHSYAMLIPSYTNLGPLEHLEISPLHPIAFDKVDGQIESIPVPGSDSLVMVRFSIPGNPYRQLKSMKLPNSARALAISYGAWSRELPDADELSLPGMVSNVEYTWISQTSAHSRGGQSTHRMSLPDGSPIQIDDNFAEGVLYDMLDKVLGR